MFKNALISAAFCLLSFSLYAKEEKKTELSVDEQYENIVKSIKDNPQQAIKN